MVRTPTFYHSDPLDQEGLIIFYPTTSSFPSRRQHLTEYDKILVNFALTLNTTMFADGHWAIKVAKLTAGAKKFLEVLS